MLENTKLLHGYPVIDEHTGAASIPKYQAATFNQTDLFVSQDYTYTRFGNPTITALEEGFALLEGAKYGFAFSSGTAGISNILFLLQAGEHVLIPKEAYGGACQLAQDILPNFNIEVSFVDYSDLVAVEAAIRENTKMLYFETPSNPLLKVTDIQGVVTIARKYQLLSVADNTFMTALIQKPLDFGVDIVVESGTKFLNGHSDVVGGLVATNHSGVAATLRLYQKSFGNILGVEDAWLILRGMKTLGIRLAKSVQNAQAIARYLEGHPKVVKVHYPGLTTHGGYDIQQTQALNGGAVLSFELEDEAAVSVFTNLLKLPLIAVSLGGVESIVSYPKTMSHACISEEERKKQGISDGLLRFSCGIEEVEDLIEDLAAALSVV